MRASFTIDLEPDCPPFLHTWRGVTEGMPRLLALLDRAGVVATFFATGSVAERHPEVIEALVARGHELGAHGYSHRRFDQMSWSEARDEIRACTRLLRRFAPVTSFRAPNLRLPVDYLRILEDEGFTLDSSGARYKLDWYRTRGRATSLARVPVSLTSSLLRLPLSVVRPLLGRLRSPVVLFVHPWEFVDLRRERLRWDCRFGTGDHALSAVERALAALEARGLILSPMRALAVT